MHVCVFVRVCGVERKHYSVSTVTCAASSFLSVPSGCSPEFMSHRSVFQHSSSFFFIHDTTHETAANEIVLL